MDKKSSCSILIVQKIVSCNFFLDDRHHPEQDFARKVT